MTTKTMADKGETYVANWATGIADRAGLGVGHIAHAMYRAGVVDEATWPGLESRFIRREVVPEVAALTPETVRPVIAEVKKIKAGIAARKLTHCHTCGLPLGRDGECDECV